MVFPLGHRTHPAENGIIVELEADGVDVVVDDGQGHADGEEGDNREKNSSVTDEAVSTDLRVDVHCAPRCLAAETFILTRRPAPTKNPRIGLNRTVSEAADAWNTRSGEKLFNGFRGIVVRRPFDHRKT